MIICLEFLGCLLREGMGSCLLSSFLLFIIRYIRYLIAIWCISFMVLSIIGRGLRRSFKRFMLLLCMPPHTHVEMTVRGATY